ncbi:MAG TPA: hypothetical protein VG860_23355 [Terriglobia bacterium]|jgi:hypothetical protein|nr:hypothetical protein [Terriglobia bacterium]
MRLLRFLYIVLCFLMGLMLLFAPWLLPWPENYFFLRYSWVQAAASNYYVRGAVSGIGLADIALGVWETGRRSRNASSVPGP